MKVETANVNERTNTIEIHVSMDVLKYPEVLPLTLRNIVVLLARRIPRGDIETFKAYMSVVCDLERTFRSLND
jgi:hypothetical protein